MVKPEWGLKRICPSCGTRYYDMLRDPIICPKCGAAFDPETFSKTNKRSRAAPPEVPVEPIAEEEIDTEIPAEEGEAGEEGEEIVIEGGEEVEGEEEEEEEVIEDASELGEDEDDMAEVIENVENEEER